MYNKLTRNPYNAHIVKRKPEEKVFIVTEKSKTEAKTTKKRGRKPKKENSNE